MEASLGFEEEKLKLRRSRQKVKENRQRTGLIANVEPEHRDAIDKWRLSDLVIIESVRI